MIKEKYFRVSGMILCLFILVPYFLKAQNVERSAAIYFESYPGKTSMDSIITFQWDYKASSWFYLNSIFYSYDSNNNETGWKTKTYDGRDAEGVNIYDNRNNLLEFKYLSSPVFFNYNYTYDDDNNMLSCSSGGLEYLYSYDTRHNCIGELFRIWNGSSLVNIFKYAYVYDEFNRIISKTRQYSYDGNWINNFQFVYSYNSNGKQTTSVHSAWQGQSYDTNTVVINTYNNNGNKISEISRHISDQKWVDDYKFYYTYDSNGNLSSQLYEYWSNLYREDYQYDSLNRKISLLGLNKKDTVWIPDIQHHYYYDSNNILETDVRQKWDGTSWINQDSILFFHRTNSIATVIADISLPEKLLVFPNPSSGQLTVKNLGNHLLLLDVYNSLGQKILSNKSDEPITSVDLSNHPKGVYLIKENGGNVSQKIIIE